VAGITLTQAEAQLAVWLAADTAVASGQAYSIAGRALTRANAREIRENIEYWDQKVADLTHTAEGSLVPRTFAGQGGRGGI
jgi:uncharacterized membrane protein